MHDRSRENRLRRAARSQGLRLEKSRARDRGDLTFGGYMLVNIERNEVAYGVAGHTGRGYKFSLDAIESYLSRRAKVATKSRVNRTAPESAPIQNSY